VPAHVLVGNRIGTRQNFPVLRLDRTRASASALLFASLVCAAALTSSCSEEKPKGTARPPRLVVLGLDAGTWQLLDKYFARGILPNLARLRSQGASAVLNSIEPSSSPVIWTSIATGKVPDKHGITWFVRFPQGPGKPVPVDRRMRKTQAIWNMLSGRGMDVAVVGWFVTWPAEEVNGRLVSDMAHYGDLDGESFPPYFLRQLAPVEQSEAIRAMASFMDFPYDARRAIKAPGNEPPELDYLVYDRFIRAYTRDLFYLRATERVLSEPPLPDALFVYLRGTDDVQHGFWKFMDPEPFGNVPPDQVQQLGKVIENYWVWVDKRVGDILSRYKQPPMVLVVSDHGAGPAVGNFGVDVPEYLHLSGSHRPDGILIANGPGVRKGVKLDPASIMDVTPTLLHYLRLPVGDDMDGTVRIDLFEDSVADREIQRVPTYDKPGQAAGSVPTPIEPAVEGKVLEHLRSLGYIE